MKNIYMIILCLVGILNVRALNAQDGIQIFGYSAAKFAVYSANQEPALKQGNISNTFSMFQTNLFFTTRINPKLKFFGELSLPMIYNINRI